MASRKRLVKHFKRDNVDDVTFKHSQSLEAEDVWTMKMVAGGKATVGFAGEGYNVEREEEKDPCSEDWAKRSQGTDGPHGLHTPGLLLGMLIEYDQTCTC